MKFKLLVALGLIAAIATHFALSSPAFAIATTNWSNASFPVKQFIRYTSPFMPEGRVNPVDGVRRPHWGLDIAAPAGSPIVAWWGGTVESVKFSRGGCGNEVTIVSGSWESRSCHVQAVLVKEGQQVETGQAIALVGSTGNSTGPHLHWELYFNGKILDPAKVIRAMQKARNAPDGAV